MTNTHFDERFFSDDEEILWELIEESPEAVMVDWREEEEEIIRSINQVIAPYKISFEWMGNDDIQIQYKEKERLLGLSFSLKDRYICLRAINDILQDEYELRLFELSFNSDTHLFLVKPGSWWADFDQLHPKRSAQLFRIIGPDLDFP
ncbi:MAG: hypothetical protein HY774_24725 [Acidobacteria bacterium]|nr:hypothetical protein [Acidobacteriota bacterium]